MNITQYNAWQAIVKTQMTQISSFEIMKLIVEGVVAKMERSFKNVGRFPEDQQNNIIDDLQNIQVAKRELFNAILHLKLTGGLL